METPIEALIVAMGEHFVLLPFGTMSLDFFDTIEGELRRVCNADDAATGRVQLSGPVKKLPWPKYPMHVHDGQVVRFRLRWCPEPPDNREITRLQDVDDLHDGTFVRSHESR